MRSKRSIAWDYFQKNLNSTVTCTLCNKTIRFFGGTTNLLQHFERKHPVQAAESRCFDIHNVKTDVIDHNLPAGGEVEEYNDDQASTSEPSQKRKKFYIEKEFKGISKESSNLNTEDYLDDEENIFIEYLDDSDVNTDKLGTRMNRKETVLAPKIMWMPVSKSRTVSGKSQSERLRAGQSTDSSISKEMQNELLKIQLKIARKDLELKEEQLKSSRREDERRQKEHEITLKIKEAQLQVILTQNNLHVVDSVPITET